MLGEGEGGEGQRYRFLSFEEGGGFIDCEALMGDDVGEF